MSHRFKLSSLLAVAAALAIAVPVAVSVQPARAASDTMPYRLSPGQVNIPGLSAMTSASNFSGTLDLYNGVLDEAGGGMSMQAWVPEAVALSRQRAVGARQSRRVRQAPGIWAFGAISLNRAPHGSSTVASRPYGVSSAGRMTFPPSSAARASVASASFVQM